MELRKLLMIINGKITVLKQEKEKSDKTIGITSETNHKLMS